jgi:hypothetical protein
VQSDSARAFTGGPKRICRDGSAFRMLRDWLLRYPSFAAAESSALVSRRHQEQLTPQHKHSGRLGVISSEQQFLGFHNHMSYHVSHSTVVQSP